MRTVKLNTGVVVEFDDNDNMLNVESPYHKNETPTTTSVLRYLANQIKQIIKPKQEFYDPNNEWWNCEIK